MTATDGLPTGSERETVEPLSVRMLRSYTRACIEGRKDDATVLNDAAWAIETLEADRDMQRLAASPPEVSREPPAHFWDGNRRRPVPPVEPEGGRKRCAEIAPDGYQRCADFDGHGGNHTLLAPSGAPWFDGRPEGDER